MKIIIFYCVLSSLVFSACEDYQGKYEKLLEENSAQLEKLSNLEEEDKLIRGEYSKSHRKRLIL